MAAVVLRNNVEADGPIVAPTHADGTGYRYCLYFNGYAAVAFADTHEDLLDALIPGYAEMSEEDAAFERIKLAGAVAAVVQAEILASVDREAVSDDDWAVLVAPRLGRQPRADWWACEVPLVVVETGYEPFTDVPRPASALSAAADAPNLWWIRPAEEEDFLLSLHEVGFVRLMESTIAA